MWKIIAFSESVAPNSAFVNIAAIADQTVKWYGDYNYIGAMNKLFGAIGFPGNNAGAIMQLSSPSMLVLSKYNIAPLELDIHPGAKVHHAVDPKVMKNLVYNEQLEALVYSTDAVGGVCTVVVFLSDKEITVVKGDITPVRFQFTAAQVASTWTFSTISFVDELPVGTYQVVGMRVVADGCIACRLCPVGGINRPGAPCVATVEEDGEELFRRGNLGEWLTFDSNQPPGIENLGSAAVGSAPYEGVLDLIKVS